MRSLKRTLAIALVLAMAIVFVVPSFAAEQNVAEIKTGTNSWQGLFHFATTMNGWNPKAVDLVMEEDAEYQLDITYKGDGELVVWLPQAWPQGAYELALIPSSANWTTISFNFKTVPDPRWNTWATQDADGWATHACSIAIVDASVEFYSGGAGPIKSQPVPPLGEYWQWSQGDGSTPLKAGTMYIAEVNLYKKGDKSTEVIRDPRFERTNFWFANDADGAPLTIAEASQVNIVKMDVTLGAGGGSGGSANNNPKTGNPSMIFLAFGALLVSGSAIFFFRKKIMAK